VHAYQCPGNNPKLPSIMHSQAQHFI